MSISRIRKNKATSLMACCKGGGHTGQYVKYICLHEECQSVDLVLCDVCRRKSHSNHQVVEIGDFFEQLKHRVNGKRIQEYSTIQSLVQEAESVCTNSLLNFQAHFQAKIQALSNTMRMTFTTWTHDATLFEEHHALAVIDDIASMQDETDAMLFTSQLRKILPHISFDTTPTPKLKTTNSTTSVPPSTIKAISKNLLGIPPVSAQEVHSFQQSLLHALKKTSDTLTDSMSSIRYARKRSSNSIGNRSCMSDYSQSIHDTEADDLSTRSYSQNVLDQQRNNSLTQSEKLLHPYASGSATGVAAAASNGGSVSQASVLRNSRKQNSSMYGSHSPNQRRSSYISEKGTYRADDLISHHDNVIASKNSDSQELNEKYAGYSNNIDSNAIVNMTSTYRSKRNSASSWVPAATVVAVTSTPKSALSFNNTNHINNRKCYLNNKQLPIDLGSARGGSTLNQSQQQLQPSADQTVIDEVQRQVDGIQQSLNNLKGQVDFQRVIVGSTQNNEDENMQNNSNINGILSKSQLTRKSSGLVNQSTSMPNDAYANEVNGLFNQDESSMLQKSQLISGSASVENGEFQQTYQGIMVDPRRKGPQQLSKGGSIYSGNGNSPYRRVSTVESLYRGSLSSRAPAVNLSFAEKFSRFQELSQSSSQSMGRSSAISRESSLVGKNTKNSRSDESENNSNNNSTMMYSRYFHDSSAVREGKELEEEERRNRETALNQKKVHFRFSTDLHHEFVKVSKYVASGKNESFSTRLVLLEPTVEIIPHREITFSFLIKSCRNEEFSHPLALGLCHKNIVSENNFEFSAANLDENNAATAASSDQRPHGCYLLTATGYLRNHAYAKQDMKKVPVRFNVNDIIVCHFNPFKKTLQFTKKSTSETCTLNVDTIPTDKLYPCVRISYAQDTVEYIQSQ